MRTPDSIRIVRVALRLSLAAAFLSAIADRFGWWGPFGQSNWGSMDRFVEYAHQLVPFASGWVLTVIVWGTTATEATLGVLLLTGWHPKLVGAASCVVLIVFGTAMAVSLGVESPLSYSVFSAASAAAAYAVLGTTLPPPTAGVSRPDNRNRRKPTDGAPAGQRCRSLSGSVTALRQASESVQTPRRVPIIGSEG